MEQKEKPDWEYLEYHLTCVTDKDLELALKILHKTRRYYHLFFTTGGGGTLQFLPLTEKVLLDMAMYGEIIRWIDKLWPKKSKK